MGRVSGATVQAGQRFHGEPAMSGDHRSRHEDPGLLGHLRSSAGLRSPGQGIRTLHDLTAQEGSAASVL